MLSLFFYHFPLPLHILPYNPNSISHYSKQNPLLFHFLSFSFLMAMPCFFLTLLFFLSTLHACDASRLRFFQSSNFVSRIEPHSISQGIWTDHDQDQRSFYKNNSDKVLPHKEIIVGIEMLKVYYTYIYFISHLVLSKDELVI